MKLATLLTTKRRIRTDRMGARVSARCRRFTFVLAVVCALHGYAASVVRADEVLDWNAIAIRCVFVAPAVGGAMQPRMLAIVHVAMFDALNGIERRYTPIHVMPDAPRGASRRAA